MARHKYRYAKWRVEDGMWHGFNYLRPMTYYYQSRGLKAAMLWYALYETDNHHLMDPRLRNGDNYLLKVSKKAITLELHVKYTNKGKPFLAQISGRDDTAGAHGFKTFIGRPEKEEGK